MEPTDGADFIQVLVQLCEFARERIKKGVAEYGRDNLETGLLLGEAVIELVMNGRDPRSKLIQKLYILALLYFAEGELFNNGENDSS